MTRTPATLSLAVLLPVAALAVFGGGCSDSIAAPQTSGDQTDAGSAQDNTDNSGNTGDAADPCTAYCNTMQSACTGGLGTGNSQYSSMTGCMSFCDGSLGDDSSGGTRDTIACRMTHAQRAKADPKSECPIAGTTGGGVCEGDTNTGEHGRCAAFCNRVVQLCTKDNGVDPQPYQSADECMAACGTKFKFDSTQPELTQSGNTLNCRQYHLVLAWDGTGADTPMYHCPHLGFPATAFCQ